MFVVSVLYVSSRAYAVPTEPNGIPYWPSEQERLLEEVEARIARLSELRQHGPDLEALKEQRDRLTGALGAQERNPADPTSPGLNRSTGLSAAASEHATRLSETEPLASSPIAAKGWAVPAGRVSQMGRSAEFAPPIPQRSEVGDSPGATFSLLVYVCGALSGFIVGRFFVKQGAERRAGESQAPARRASESAHALPATSMMPATVLSAARNIAQAEPSAAAERRYRVLLAEDSPTTREYLSALLTNDPQIELVGEAENGEAALILAKMLKPDVVVMDITMPVMDGFAATEAIMMEAPTPIVIVSSNLDIYDAKVAAKALQAGGVAVLRKPAGEAAPENGGTRGFIDTVKAVGAMKVRPKRSSVHSTSATLH
jgi:CheY-like chemotaxis protein